MKMGFFQNKKVLVAGGAGLIGSTLIGRLLAEGSAVRATWHSAPPPVLDDRVEYIQCDLTKSEECRTAVEGMRYVFHCAATHGGAAAILGSPMAFVTNNVVIDSQMFEAAYDAKIEKLLWLGSCTSYPPFDGTPLKEDQILEGDPHQGYYFVGWMKRFGEVLCRMYGEKLSPPMTTIVLRPTLVYGPGDSFDPENSHFLPALIRRVVERQDPLEVWGLGQEVRDLIYIDDVINAAVSSMEKLNSYTTLNVGLGKGHSIKEVLELILELEGCSDTNVVFDPTKPTTVPVQSVDTNKAEQTIGFKAGTSLREGLAKTIAWYKQSQSDLPVSAGSEN